jgi:hypothetical protein
MLSGNSTDKTSSISSIVDHVMDTNTQLNPDMIDLFNNLENDERTLTIKRLNVEMNSSSSSNDQSPKKLMKFAFNKSDTVENKLDYLLELVQILDNENFMIRKSNIGHSKLILKQNHKIKNLEDDVNNLKNYIGNFNKYVEDVLKVEIENIKMKIEDKVKNDVIANNNINMNDIKAKLFSEICVMHEKKVIEEPVVEKIINLINDNDLQKKKKENNVMIFGLKMTNDDMVTDKVNDLLQKIGVTKVEIKKVNKIIKKDLSNDVAPIIVELVNQSDRFVILKAAKALAKINEDDDTHINISLDLTEIERKRQKKLVMDRNILNDKLKSNNNPGEIKFYYGIRNNHLVKLDKVILNDGIDVT